MKKSFEFWILLMAGIVALEMLLYYNYREQITCDNFRSQDSSIVSETLEDVVWNVDRFPDDVTIQCARGVYPK